ncbi:MAG: hypothetical protein RL199_1150 [Pseudomonadota bacterium]|jgi:hypothetical protein
MILTPNLPASLNVPPVDGPGEPVAAPAAGPGESGRHDADFADAGFAAALSQFLPPPTALARPADPVASATSTATTPTASTATSVTQGRQGPAEGAGRTPAVDLGRPGTESIDPHTAPSVSGLKREKAERGRQPDANSGLAAGLRAHSPSVADLVGAHPQRQFNDALGELRGPRGGTDVVETLRAGVENRIRGAILNQAAHLHLQLPSGDLGVHVQLKDGVADVRLEGPVAEAFRGRESELRTALAAKGIEVGEVRATTPSEAAVSGAGVEAALRTQRPEAVRPAAAVPSVADAASAVLSRPDVKLRAAAGPAELTALQTLSGRRPEAASPLETVRAVAAADVARQSQWETETGRQAVPGFVAANGTSAAEAGPSEQAFSAGVANSGSHDASTSGDGRSDSPFEEGRPEARDGTAPASVKNQTPAPRRGGQRSVIHVEA